MALTFTTGMTSIDPADSATDWVTYKITAGGATPTLVESTDIFVEGTQSVALKPTASKDQGFSFDYYNANGNTVLDLTATGNEVIGVWIQVTSKATLDTFQNGGIYIGVCSDDATPTSSNTWSKWYVGGSDQFQSGWVYYQVDTRKTASATSNGGATLSSIYRVFFGTLASSTVPRAESFYVDASWYGRPIYTLTGDDGVTTADWADFLNDSTTNENGLIQEINGAYELSCGIQFGDNAQTATTDFSDATGQQINFKRHVYYSGGIVDALTYGDYYSITAEGAAADITNVTIGSIVGSDKGILGGGIRSLDATNVPVIIDFDTDQAHLAVKLYGIIWQDITGSFKLGANTGFDVFSNQFIGCAQVDPVGACEIRNCSFINTVSTTGSLLWNTSIDVQDCSFVANTTGAGIEHPTWNGTNSGTATNTGSETTTLYCSSTTGISVNDYVYNETDKSFGRVTNIDSGTQITHTALEGGTNNYWTTSDAYSVATAYSYTNLVFSGNTNDVDNTTSPANVVAISKAGTSDPSTYPSGDFVVIQGSVTVKVTVLNPAGQGIQDVQTSVHLANGTEVMNDDTNGDGELSTTYAGTTPAAAYIRTRKSSTGETRYRPFSTSGTIQSGTGLDATIVLQKDNIALA